MEDYNSTTDQQLTRLAVDRQPNDPNRPFRRKEWPLEKPIYDIRVDAYWLVTKNAEGYRFAGPIALSKNLIGMLPALNEFERRHILRHLPIIPHAPYGVQMDLVEEEENDGA